MPPRNYLRRIALTAIGVAMLGPIVMASYPKPVEAVGGLGDVVFDPTNFVKTTITAAQSIAINAESTITAHNSAFQFLKGTTLDPLAYQVSQLALQAVVNSTIRWINSGFNGSPAFVTNLNATLLQIGDAQANSFIRQLASNSAIKSPFQSLVASSVNASYLQSTGANGFFNQNPFTLGQVSPNPTAFLAGGTNGFAQGGWNAWLSTAMHSANNPYGATILANQAIGNQVAGAQDTQKTELQWGNGFLSYRGNCQTSTTGQSLGGSLGSSAGGGTSLGGNSLGGSLANTAAVTTSLSGSSGCQSQNIVTPGGAISNSLYKSLGAGIDSLVNAKQFDEIVGALLSQLVNHVLGTGGLAGISQPSSSGGGTYFDQPDPTAASVTASVGTTFAQTLTTQVSGLQSFQASWTAIDQAALAAQSALQANTLCPANQTTLSTLVQPALNQATTELSDASASIAAITKIQNELPPANSTTVQTTQLSQVSSDYTALLASPTYPSTSDFTNAQSQSDTSATTGSTSLITQLNQAAQTASTCGVAPTTTTTTTST